MQYNPQKQSVNACSSLYFMCRGIVDMLHYCAHTHLHCRRLHNSMPACTLRQRFNSPARHVQRPLLLLQRSITATGAVGEAGTCHAEPRCGVIYKPVFPHSERAH